ncbi:MAG: DUF5615 family PIN-like protein [Candidatus Kapaibacterium sp.]
MRILVDECVPRQLCRFFPDHEIQTVREIGWSGIKNGELIRRAEERFDIFITSDQNIRYQQNLTNRKIAIIELSTNDRDTIISSSHKVILSVQSVQPSDYLEVTLP